MHTPSSTRIQVLQNLFHQQLFAIKVRALFQGRILCSIRCTNGNKFFKNHMKIIKMIQFAPEGFNEFFNQRRRWIPSTLVEHIKNVPKSSLIKTLLGKYNWSSPELSKCCKCEWKHFSLVWAHIKYRKYLRTFRYIFYQVRLTPKDWRKVLNKS